MRNYKPAEESLVAKLLKFAPFYHKSPPRVVMFGPGLESNTSSLVHKLLWDDVSPFQVQHMFSGLQDGKQVHLRQLGAVALNFQLLMRVVKIDKVLIILMSIYLFRSWLWNVFKIQ